MKRRAFLTGLAGLLGSAVWPLPAAADGFAVQRGLKLAACPLPPGFAWGERADLLEAHGRLYLMGRDNLWLLNGGQPLFAAPLALQSATASRAGTLLAIAGDRLGLVQGGLFLPALAPPSTDARLAPGPGDTVHLFGPAAGKIWRFDGKNAQLVVRAAGTLDAVTLVGQTLVFATPDGIFRLAPGDSAGLLFPLAGHTPLTGMAAVAETAEIFVATADAVYRLDEGEMRQIVAGLGGTLAVLKDGLLIADPRRQRLALLSRAA